MARKADQIASLFASVGFKIDRAGLKEVDVALGRVEKRLAGIVKAFQGMSGSKSLTGALRATAKDSGKAAAGIDEITARLKAGIPALSTYTQQMRVLAAELRSVTGARPNLPRVPAGGGRGTGGSGTSPYSNRRDTGVFGDMSRTLFGGGASGVLRGLFPGIGLAYGAMNIVQGGREVMATENALSAITGSQAQGKAELEYTKDFSKKYGLDWSTQMQGYKGILAATEGSGVDKKGARQIFEGASLYGAALGIDSEKMKRGMTALTQMMSKGKVMSEELKGQLAEALPGAVQKFAASLGVSVPKMYKMMEAGEVTSDKLVEFGRLLEETAKKGGALDRWMTSSIAAQNNMTTAWTELRVALLKNGLDKALSKIFNLVADLLNVLVELLPWILFVAGAFVTWKASMMALGLISFVKDVWNVVKAVWALNIALAATGGSATKAAFVSLGLMLKTLARTVLMTFAPVLIIMDTIWGMFSDDLSLIEYAAKKSGAVGFATDGMEAISKLFGVFPGSENKKPKLEYKPGDFLPPTRDDRALDSPFPLPSSSGGVSNTNTIVINGGDLAQVKRVVEDAMGATFDATRASYPRK